MRIVSMTSYPGTRGYWIPGQCSFLTRELRWRIPQAGTVTRTQAACGSGISISTISNGFVAAGTCNARIFRHILLIGPFWPETRTEKWPGQRQAAFSENLRKAGLVHREQTIRRGSRLRVLFPKDNLG